jgi:hypothetical protein
VVRLAVVFVKFYVGCHQPSDAQHFERAFISINHAEEFAHNCDRQGHRWVMFRDADRPYTEGGATYTMPCYVVETQ